MRLTNEITLAKYGKTNRKQCECGNVATVPRTHGAICERCAKLEAERGQRFDGHSTGETCGTGYDPFTVHL